MLNCISHVAALSFAARGHYAGGARLRPSAAPTMRMPDGVLDLLDPTVVVLAHAWADGDDDDILGDVWRRAASFAGVAVGLEEFSAVTWVRRAPDL